MNAFSSSIGVESTDWSEVEFDMVEGDGIEAYQSNIKLDVFNVPQIGVRIREGVDEKKTGMIKEKVAVDLNKGLPVESNATIHRRLHREEIAGEFEAFLLKAVRELQSTDDVVVLGLTGEQKFEPLYYMLMGTSELGFEPEIEHLGPPPWAR